MKGDRARAGRGARRPPEGRPGRGTPAGGEAGRGRGPDREAGRDRSTGPGGRQSDRREVRGERPRAVARQHPRDVSRERPREEFRERAREAPEETGGERTVAGIHPVLEALRAHPDEVDRLYLVEGAVPSGAAAEILSRARDAGVRVERVPRERLATLAGGGLHQGVAARVRGVAYVGLEELLARARASGRPALVLVLDGIQDPHNLGAILRSAEALGAHGVVLPKDRSVGITAGVARASAGALEHVPVARVTNLSRALEELKTAGLWVAAAEPEGAEALWDARLDGPLALVVGAEGAGVRPGVLAHCDLKLRIPMLGQIASLNASVSAALVLYEVARQRAVAGPVRGSAPESRGQA